MMSYIRHVDVDHLYMTDEKPKLSRLVRHLITTHHKVDGQG